MGWSRFLHRARWDTQRTQELQDYLAHEIDDNLARGMDREAATRAAYRKLGNPTRIREEIYEMNTVRVLESIWRDLRFGLRLLLRTPTFSIVAILTLALGTGANAAIFQLMNAVRLRPLPVENPETLVSIGIDNHGRGRTGRGFGGRSIHTEPLFRTLTEQQRAFSSVIAWGSETWDLAAEGELRPVQGLYVSGNFFDTLGVRAHAGRLLTAGDDRSGCGAPGVVLSYGFWQAHYAGQAAAIGQTITLDRRPFDIIGVAPRGFFGVEVGRTFDVAVPMCAELLIRAPQVGTGQRHVWWLDMMARLQPGWTIEQAQAHVQAISPAIFEATISPRYNAETAKTYAAYTFTAESAEAGVSSVRRRYATQLWVLLGATGLVLLLACANLANLMLARASARDREMAVRLAIGASRSRLVRQLLSESLLIAGFGALGGVFFAQSLSTALVVFLSTESNQLFVDLTPDWRMFAFIAAIATAACLAFGLSPALKATGAAPGAAMQVGGRSGTDGREAMTLRRSLVVVQIAVSMMLVVGALLFGRSLRNLSSVDLGFREQDVMAANVALQRTAVKPEALGTAFEQIIANVRAVPGVDAAAETLVLPLGGSQWIERIVVGGVQQDGLVNFNQVGGEYFRTLGVPLVAGRPFDSRDRLDATFVAIVNETFARRYFPNGSPLGRPFHMEATPGQPHPDYQIVGIVRDTKYLDLKEQFAPIAYLPLSQEREVYPMLSIIVRSKTTEVPLTTALTRAITSAVPGAAVSYDTISGYVQDALVTERLMATLSAFFGLLGLLIATIGLYGVISYTVARRKVEIGIRMALGADPGRVVRMVLAESGMLVAIGVVAGAALALGASRWASNLLYAIQPWDPTSLVLAIATLGSVSVLAAWIPARRASRLPPTIALRD
jgi:putative ABC transport system permease protein